ncbi:MAG: hypothetical protein DMF95_04410 [Acidobacteria bacterium]|nr:MAG: hypothetical protein DMF95_04410 [Acidobacteriota bacterium]
MECRDVREMADSFLGEELLTETNHEILRHLDTCPVCRADLAGRRALREGVQRAFHRAPELGASPEFIARLRNKLQDTAHQGSARRGVRFPGWWALAATVLLAVALGLAYRGRDRITAATPFVPPVPQELTDGELLGALGRIPVVFQEVIVLCDVEELTYKEIADALAIPLGTVMSRLHRGRALLRAELGHRRQSIVSGPTSETTHGMPRRS